MRKLYASYPLDKRQSAEDVAAAKNGRARKFKYEVERSVSGWHIYVSARR